MHYLSSKLIIVNPNFCSSESITCKYSQNLQFGH